MSASARRREILRRLSTDSYLEVKDLAGDLGVDMSTVRRDLDLLEREGQIQRTHGGARPVPGVTADLPYSVKRAVRSDAKAAIARQAAQQVHDGDTVILDSGSTTYEVAVALRKHRELSVITNDLRISTYIASLRGFRLLVTGGELLGSVYTLVGDHAVEFLGSYAADWAFLGADAIDTHSGVTNTNTLEVPVKRAMIKAARTAVVVADSSKFGRRALAKVAGLDEIDFVVTDPDLPGETAEHWGIRLIQAVRA